MSRPRSPSAREAAPVFAALGDPTRLHLIGRLSTEGPLSITRLSEGVEISRQAITKHLATLAEVGLVRDRREGRDRIWQLEARPLGKAKSYLDRISAQWDDAIDRLRQFVEDES